MDRILTGLNNYIQSNTNNVVTDIENKKIKGFAISQDGKIKHYIDGESIPKNMSKVPKNIISKYSSDINNNNYKFAATTILKKSNSGLLNKIKYLFRNTADTERRFIQDQESKELDNAINTYLDFISNDNLNPLNFKESLIPNTLSILKKIANFNEHFSENKNFYMTINSILEDLMPAIIDKSNTEINKHLAIFDKHIHIDNNILSQKIKNLNATNSSYPNITKFILLDQIKNNFIKLDQLPDDSQLSLKISMVDNQDKNNSFHMLFPFKVSTEEMNNIKTRFDIPFNNGCINDSDDLPNLKLNLKMNRVSFKIFNEKQKRPKYSSYLKNKTFTTPLNSLKNFIHETALVKNRNINSSKRVKLKELGGESVLFTDKSNNILEGMFFPNTKPKENAKTILLCLGSHHSYEVYAEPIVKELLDQGHNVMAFNYSGFGNSQGKASEKGVYDSSEAAYRFLKQEKNCTDSNIVAWGYSLGSGAASKLATKHNIDIVIDRGFSSMTQKATDSVSGFLKPIASILTSIVAPLDNISKLRKAKGNVLVVQGKQDTDMKEKNHGNKFKKLSKTHKNIRYKTVDSSHSSNWYKKNTEVIENFLND